MKLFSYSILAAAIFTLTLACSSTQSTTSSGSGSSDSMYPGWYNAGEFDADSLSYFGYGVAIDADSASAVERAQQQARVNLERNIGDLTEEIRTTMTENGSTDAVNTDFIILLRKAHTGVGEAAEISEVRAGSVDNYYRAFASVMIPKRAVADVLENGFNGHPRYWGGFSSAELFSDLFK